MSTPPRKPPVCPYHRHDMKFHATDAREVEFRCIVKGCKIQIWRPLALAELAALAADK